MQSAWDTKGIKKLYLNPVLFPKRKKMFLDWRMLSHSSGSRDRILLRILAEYKWKITEKLGQELHVLQALCKSIFLSGLGWPAQWRIEGHILSERRGQALLSLSWESAMDAGKEGPFSLHSGGRMNEGECYGCREGGAFLPPLRWENEWLSSPANSFGKTEAHTPLLWPLAHMLACALEGLCSTFVYVSHNYPSLILLRFQTLLKT